MTSLTAIQLTKRLLELVGAKEGSTLDISKLKDGSVLIRRVTETSDLR